MIRGCWGMGPGPIFSYSMRVSFSLGRDWNLEGINGIAKREEMVKVFRKEKF